MQGCAAVTDCECWQMKWYCTQMEYTALQYMHTYMHTYMRMYVCMYVCMYACIICMYNNFCTSMSRWCPVHPKDNTVHRCFATASLTAAGNKVLYHAWLYMYVHLWKHGYFIHTHQQLVGFCVCACASIYTYLQCIRAYTSRSSWFITWHCSQFVVYVALFVCWKHTHTHIHIHSTSRQDSACVCVCVCIYIYIYIYMCMYMYV